MNGKARRSRRPQGVFGLAGRAGDGLAIRAAGAAEFCQSAGDEVGLAGDEHQPRGQPAQLWRLRGGLPLSLLLTMAGYTWRLTAQFQA